MIKPTDYLESLQSALDQYQYDDVRPLAERIDPTAFTSAEVKKALGMLRRKRRFVDLEHVAGLFTVSGRTEPIIRRQWAQALLDQNRVGQGLGALRDMEEKVHTDPVEGPEVRGLIGRAYKQLYVNEGGPENLRQAVASYQVDWQTRRGDYRWQGINVAALLARGKRDGIDVTVTDTPEHIAETILADIEENGVGGVWDYATAMEASVALEHEDSALTWAKQYLQHPAADAFEIGSTLRQLREIWQLEQTSLGHTLLPILEYALLQQEGGSVEPLKLGGKIEAKGFEAVWGDESSVHLQWLDTLHIRCHAIARVNDLATGAPKGTGFVAQGSVFRPEWGEAPVFLTNSHVISTHAADEAPLRPGAASAEFTRLPGRPQVMLGPLLFSSPRVELDVSILSLVPPSGAGTIVPPLDGPEIDLADSARPRIYVIGHPGGRDLAVSLYDNSLEEYERHYVRYRCPTESGHSGSPVYDRQLKSFAIHHRAREDKKLNEGILLKKIQSAVTNLRSGAGL